MSAVIIEHEFSKPLMADNVLSLAEAMHSCFEIYRVRPRRHYFARDGMRCACVFDAPDAEAMRNVFRTAPAPAPKRIWAATIHCGPGGDDAAQSPVLQNSANVLALVERSFPAPVVFDDVQAMEDAGAGCLNLHRVRFLRSYFSTNSKLMICLYEAPDVEAVRTANRQVGLPFDQIWGAQILVD